MGHRIRGVLRSLRDGLQSGRKAVLLYFGLEQFSYCYAPRRQVKSGFTSTPVHQERVYRGPRLNGRPALCSVVSVYTYRRTALAMLGQLQPETGSDGIPNQRCGGPCSQEAALTIEEV